MNYVYYLLEPTTLDIIYVGRSNKPLNRQRAFYRKNKLKTVMGLCQRHSNFQQACQAELVAIAKHWPKFNKRLCSSTGTLGQPASLGYRHTEGAKSKLRDFRLGSKQTEAAKRKISVSLIGNQYAKGFKHSDATKVKVQAANVGSKRSAESKIRMKAAQLLQWAKKKEKQCNSQP